jgi:hypothetical protein
VYKTGQDKKKKKKKKLQLGHVGTSADLYRVVGRFWVRGGVKFPYNIFPKKPMSNLFCKTN